MAIFQLNIGKFTSVYFSLICLLQYYIHFTVFLLLLHHGCSVKILTEPSLTLTLRCSPGSFLPLIDILLSKHTSVSLMCLCPSVPASFPLLMFLPSLFPPPINCRNPSTAFYQAFRPSRLRGSKPVSDRYELVCVYMHACGPAWLSKLDLTVLQLHTPCRKMSF